MTAGDWLAASAMVRLDQNAALDPLRVYDWLPERAAMPYAQVEDPVLRADDGAGVTGRVGTLGIAFRDGGERPARLRLLMARVEEQMATLDPDLGGDGWRLAGIALSRTRLARVRDGWVGRLEWSVRLYRVN
ncbi:hypothetical protein [uncultured Sphingomonas sp.]|uniref:hypothetical protein n=1 Tax=uncultured Sphingomonas sp. TaxID=158754 RepID=UPI0035CC3DD6